MPPVLNKLPNANLDSSRVLPRSLPKLPGLAQPSKCAEISQAFSKGKENALPTVNEPDTDMIGSVEVVEEFPQPSSTHHGIGELSKSPPTETKPSERAPPKASGPQWQKRTTIKSSPYFKACAVTRRKDHKKRRSEGES